jgi:hypothetical protein
MDPKRRKRPVVALAMPEAQWLDKFIQDLIWGLDAVDWLLETRFGELPLKGGDDHWGELNFLTRCIKRALAETIPLIPSAGPLDMRVLDDLLSNDKGPFRALTWTIQTALALAERSGAEGQYFLLAFKGLNAKLTDLTKLLVTLQNQDRAPIGFEVSAEGIDLKLAKALAARAEKPQSAQKPKAPKKPKTPLKPQPPDNVTELKPKASRKRAKKPAAVGSVAVVEKAA